MKKNSDGGSRIQRHFALDQFVTPDRYALSISGNTYCVFCGFWLRDILIHFIDPFHQ